MAKLKYPALLTGAREPQLGAPHPLPPFDLGRLGSSLAGTVTRKLIGPVMTVLRTLGPVWRFGGLAIVTREAEVRAVLGDPAHFEVPFGPEMTQLAGGTNFVLGLEGPGHDRQRRIIEAVVRRGDVARIGRMSRDYAEALLDAAHGEIDAQRDLIMRVAAETCCRYFGLRPADPDAFAGWAMAISNVLFADPFGSPDNATLAANGAARLRRVIDDAIDHAHRVRHRGDDTLVDRLVTLQGKMKDGPSDAEIRAILVGLVAGFVPTNSLAGGKVLEFIAGHPEAVAAGIAAARAGDDVRMRRVVLEAARLNPALAPGQWRYCRNGGTVAGRRIKPGSTVVVATMSALRDRRAFPNPRRFDPDRVQQPGLLFGTGLHDCIGRELATAQLTATFMALLSRDGIERSLPDLRLRWLGPFPWRGTLRFADPARGHDPAIACLKLARDADTARLRAMAEAMGNPASRDIRRALKATGQIHFASLNVVDLPTRRGSRAHLILEINVDGDGDEGLRIAGEALGPWLRPILDQAGHAGVGNLGAFLVAHRLRLRKWPWGPTGLEFGGRPGMSVRTIARQEALAAFAREALDSFYRRELGLGGRAANALNEVRRMIRNDPYLRRDPERAPLCARGRAFDAFLLKPRSARLAIAVWQPPNSEEQKLRVWNSPTVRALAVLAVGILIFAWAKLVGWLSSLALDPHWPVLTVVLKLTLALVGAAVFVGLLFGVPAGAFALYLRWKESRDPVDDRPASLAHVEAIAAREDAPRHAQNHIIAVNRMKPGPFRRTTFALALWGIRQVLRYWFRPGFVVIMGTIHFARWFRIPGTEAMVFQSNYDGSWESYLEDFITRAHQGQSAVWSNAAGFPRTRFLVGDGAADGDHFKRWVRKQQQPTAFWYSRFPDLTLQQIRNNALIHEGLSRATSESEARAWLACFGSTRQPPPDAIDFAEVQSLVLNGFRTLDHARFLILRLPEDPVSIGNWLSHAAGFKRDDPEPGTGYAPVSGTWLFGQMAPDFHIAFGENDRSRAAATIAFTHAGLERMRVPDLGEAGGLGDFAPSFRMGMAGRADALGDRGVDAPRHWRWSDGGRKSAHALLALHACDAATLDSMARAHVLALEIHGGAVIEVTDSVLIGDEADRRDHFGFRDGLVQPAIEGTTRAARNPVARDRIAPGEFVLGYRNAEGRYPPPIRLPDDLDVVNRLPDLDQRADQSIPDFGARADRTVMRDLGRNGAFIAVRELAQDVEGFRRQTEVAAQVARLTYPNLVSQKIDADWIAAKIVGRWPSGAPLVGHATDPGRIDADDLDIAFGAHDPLGLQCPLGAHVRRTNPRESLVPGDPAEQVIVNRHRIIRRGRSYVREDGEKGLFFIALCADLERQFEFLQQTWVQSPSFHGLVGEPDPLAGCDKGGKPVYSIPVPGGVLRVDGLSRFVSTKAGGYFFVPSRSALRYFARFAR